MLNADAWTQFVKMQGPAIQGLMTNYLEQSATAFLEMQQQMQKQARNLFGSFPFGSYGATPGAGEDKPHTPESDAGKPAPKKAGS